LAITARIYLYPFVIQVATLFKTDAEASAHPLALIPSPICFLQWKTIFGSGDNSLRSRGGPATRSRDGVCHGGASLLRLAGRVCVVTAALRGRKAVFSALRAVMSVPGVALLIPKFPMVKYLAIYDT